MHTLTLYNQQNQTTELTSTTCIRDLPATGYSDYKHVKGLKKRVHPSIQLYR